MTRSSDGHNDGGMFCIDCRFSDVNCFATNKLKCVLCIHRQKHRSLIHVDHVPQVAMGHRNQQANMIHLCTHLVGNLLRQMLAHLRTQPVGVGMPLHEACHGHVLRAEGFCAKALRQACNLEQHKNVVDIHASLVHLEDVDQQLVLNRLELALESLMAGFLFWALLSSLSKTVMSFAHISTFVEQCWPAWLPLSNRHDPPP
jgi:hypothetical protein